MNKRTYLKRLRKAMSGFSEREKENLIEYYSELIDDSYERGKTTREIFSQLESPEAVAANYKRENSGEQSDSDAFYAPHGNHRRGEEKENSSAVFPLNLIGLILGVVVAVAGAGIVVALSAVLVVLGVGGVYAVIMAFGLFKSSVSLAITQIGAGIALIGVGQLLGFIIHPICKGYGALVGWLCRGFRGSEKASLPMRRRGVATIALALVFLFGGGIMGAIGFGQLGFDYKRLAIHDDYVQKTQTAALPISRRSACNLTISIWRLFSRKGRTSHLLITNVKRRNVL